MQVTFWKFNKRMNSTKIPTENGVTINALYFKDVVAINNPTIQVSTINMNDGYNYARINGKYYFVDSVDCATNLIYNVHLRIDLLASYKTEILSNYCNILYSQSNFNKNLIDSRIPSDGRILRPYAEKSIVGYPSGTEYSEGTYAISVIGQGIMESGFTDTYFLSRQELASLVYRITGEGTTFWQDLKEWWENPIEAIVECYWLPFDASSFISLGTENIKIGKWDSEVSGHPVLNGYSSLSQQTIRFDIPWQYDDFRNLEPYTAMELYLPGVGLTTLSPSDWYGETYLDINYVLDVINGNILYNLHIGSRVIGTISGNVKVSIPVGQVQKRTEQVLTVGSGIVATGALLVSGHPAAATTSGAYAITNALNQRTTIQNGAYSGTFAMRKLAPLTAVLMLTVHETSDTPTNLASVMGRPCMKRLQLSSLSGYTQTDNANIECSAYASEKTAINSLLNGGVYIE